MPVFLANGEIAGYLDWKRLPRNILLRPRSHVGSFELYKVEESGKAIAAAILAERPDGTWLVSDGNPSLPVCESFRAAIEHAFKARE